MKIGDTIRRTSMWGEVVTREITEQKEVDNYKAMQKEGFEFEVLVDGKFEPVSRPLTIHRSAPESCAACEA